MATPPGAGEFTSTDAATLGTDLVQTAYDRYVEFALRSQPLFRNFATKKPAQQSMPGESIVFQLYNDLPVATTPLTETTDPDAVPLPSTDSVTVTLEEYGNPTITTRRLQLFALTDVDPDIANIVAYNMADSIDVLAQTPLRGGSNVLREAGGSLAINTGATSSVTSTDTAKSRDFRIAVAKLRGNNAVPVRGQYYGAVVHPDVSADLRAETGPAGWRTPQEYGVSQDRIWAGEIGLYEGAFFIENPRAYSAKDGGTSTRVHRSYVMGQQALAEAVAEEPHVVVGPIVDKLKRFRPLGWYGVLGWARYREEALFRIETAVSYPAP
jgi:N4-gp56 family major capsid protein